MDITSMMAVQEKSTWLNKVLVKNVQERSSRAVAREAGERGMMVTQKESNDIKTDCLKMELPSIVAVATVTPHRLLTPPSPSLSLPATLSPYKVPYVKTGAG
jgi:hypothetical protein